MVIWLLQDWFIPLPVLCVKLIVWINLSLSIDFFDICASLLSGALCLGLLWSGLPGQIMK